MDFNEIVGHEHAKRALEVALAGHHTCCMIGPKGFGIGMLVKATITAFGGTASDCHFKPVHILPCKCGFYGDTIRQCTCTIEEIQERHALILEQGFDIYIEVPRLKSDEIVRIGCAPSGESTAAIMARVRKAQSEYGSQDVKSVKLTATNVFGIGEDIRDLMRAAVVQLQLTAENYATVLQLARTIADLDSKDNIGLTHVAEALQYRALRILK